MFNFCLSPSPSPPFSFPLPFLSFPLGFIVRGSQVMGEINDDAILLTSRYLTSCGALFVMTFGLSGKDQSSFNKPRDKL